MSEKRIIVEQPIYCQSYADALNVSKAFAGFSFRFIGLGGVRTVRAKRRVLRAGSSSCYSHIAQITYHIPYHGDFLDYGFLDERTKHKYPNIVSELMSRGQDHWWRIISRYQSLEDEIHKDIHYYSSFKMFFDDCLKQYLNEIFIATIISLGGCHPCGAFIIRYIENNTAYEFRYFAYGNEGNYSSIDILKIYPEYDAGPIPVQQSWDWAKKPFYAKKKIPSTKKYKDSTEHQAITALTYALNRTPSEQLFYAVVGLESIFTKNEKQAKEQLKQGITKEFPFVEEKQVAKIYQYRSEFAHGDLIFPLYYDQHETHWRAIDYRKPAHTASALLLMSIRTLVARNLPNLYPQETCSTDEYLGIANNLFEGLCSANSYWRLLQQFRKNVESHNDEMNCSPAFYNIIYTALIESLYISLSKLYDWDSRSLTLRTLLSNMTCITEEKLDEDVLKKYTFCGKNFQRPLSSYEEPFFPKEVAETKHILALFGHSYNHTMVELSLEETFSLYQKWFKSLQDRRIIKNLIEQRSKIHAHNDKATNFDYASVWAEYPLTENDVEELLAFAADYLRFCIGILTGIDKAVEYVNIDDWEATLILVREGQKYLDRQFQELSDAAL